MNIRKLTTRQLLEQVWLDLLKAANFRMRNYRVNTDLTVCLFIGLYTSSLFVCLLSNLYAYIYWCLGHFTVFQCSANQYKGVWDICGFKNPGYCNGTVGFAPHTILEFCNINRIVLLEIEIELQIVICRSTSYYLITIAISLQYLMHL